ncbi:uncharacterized protein [Mytilus edulis]|uniref:uncharacterized protein n=1 Tax=Mytilus edulis TaxID=6550 RepID=UPI0039F075E8
MLRYFKDPQSPNVQVADGLAQTVALCQLCDKNTIKWKCVDCSELLCSDCKKIHERGKATRNHQISAVKDLNEEILESSVFNLECTLHHNACSMYCVTCNQCACANCVTGNHSGHTFQDLKALLDKKRKELKTVLNDVESRFIPETQQRIDSLPAHIRAHEKNIEGLKLQMEKRASALKLAVDKCLKHHYTELYRYSEDRISKFSGHKVNLSQQMKELKENQIKLRKLIQPNSTSDVATLLMSSLNILAPEGTEIAHVEFLTGNLTENDIQQEFGSLGFSRRIERQHTFDVEPTNNTAQINNRVRNAVQQNDDMVQSDVPLIDNVVRSSRLTSGLELKTLNTSLSSVTSICLAQNDTLWVGCAGSRRLELINNSERARDLPPVMTNVLGFSLAGNGDLFITDFDNCKLRKREYPSGKLTLVKDFKPQNPVSVYVNLQENSSMISVGLIDSARKLTDDYENIKGTVVMITSNGVVTNTFGNGQPIHFTVPNRITVGGYSNSLLVIDSITPESGRIISLSKDGNIQFTYNPIQNNTLNLFNPTDLVCTLNGQILICDVGNDLLHILDLNGLLDHYIDTKSCGIERPWSLALYGDSTLFIGTFTYKGGKRSKDTQKGVVYIVPDFNSNR